jgi:hypothetical protein
LADPHEGNGLTLDEPLDWTPCPTQAVVGVQGAEWLLGFGADQADHHDDGDDNYKGDEQIIKDSERLTN